MVIEFNQNIPWVTWLISPMPIRACPLKSRTTQYDDVGSLLTEIPVLSSLSLWRNIDWPNGSFPTEEIKNGFESRHARTSAMLRPTPPKHDLKIEAMNYFEFCPIFLSLQFFFHKKLFFHFKAALRQSFSTCVYCMHFRFQSNYLGLTHPM